MIDVTAPTIVLYGVPVRKNLTFGGTITYRYRYAGTISSTTSLSSIPVGAIRLGAVTT